MDKQGNDGVKKAKILLIAEAVEGLLPWYEQIESWGGVPTIWPLAEATAAKIEAAAPDVVVLDEAGLGLGRELQTAATRNQIPLLFVLQTVTDEFLEHLLGLAGADYVCQPRPLEVRLRLVRLLQNGRAQQTITTQADALSRLEDQLTLQDAEMLNYALGHAETGIWQWDRQTDKLSWSAQTSKIFGLQQNQSVSAAQDFFAAVHPADLARFQAVFQELLANPHKSHHLEYRILRRDGAVRWVEGLTFMVQGEGEGLQVVGLVSDITEQVETEASLREIESRYNAFVEQTLDGVVIVQGGVIQSGNQALVTLLGYELGELVGQQFLEFVLPAQREIVEKRNIARHAGKAVLSRYEIQMVHKSGRVVDIELSAGIIQHRGGDASFVILRDITEQKLALEELRRSEQRFRAVFNSMNDTIFIRDENKKLLDINQAACEMYGYTAAEFAELSIEEISLGESPYTTKEASDWLDKAAAEGPQRFEWRARHKDGHLFWVDISAQTAQFGERFLYVVAIRNIEKQKEAERALRQSEEKFAGAFHASPDSITIATWPSGRLIDANEGFERISGYAREEVLGKHTSQLDIYGDAAERQRVIEYFQTHNQVRNFEFKGRRKNGQPFPASISSEFIQLGGETCSITTVRDLTEQKEAEQALRFSEEKFAKAFHATPDSISITDMSNNQFIELNYGFEQVFGHRREEALGKTSSELGLYAHPEDRERKLAAVRKQGYARNLEIIGRRKSGELIMTLVSAEHFEVGGAQFFVTIVRDITEQRQAEEVLRRQEAQLRQTQQLAKLGSWTLDLATGAETWSDILYDIFGVSREVSPSYDLYAQLVHPDDLPHVEQRTREALRSGADSFYLEHRIIRPDGSEGYLWIQTFFERDETGYALRAYGTAQDVTVTKRAELERDELKALLEAAVGQSPAGIIIVDAPQGEIRLINAAALMAGDQTQRQLMDVPSHLLALNWHTYHPDGTRYRPEDALLSRAIMQGETVTGRDIIIKHDDGREWWVMANSAPIYNNEQEIIAGIVVFSDITERKQAEKALQESEETARLFQQKLQKLHEVTLKLSNLPTLDELYYTAVDLGKRELGFERFGLLLFDEEKESICGTYGTDTKGKIVDENHLRFPLSQNQAVQALLRDNQRAHVWEKTDLWSEGQWIGSGWCAISILWDGHQGIGFISADNYMSDTPPPPFVVDLMALYGNVLGYLITRKRAEQKINQYIQELQVFQQMDRAILQAESPQAIARSVLRPLQKLLECKYVEVNKYNEDPEGFHTLANTFDLVFDPELIPKRDEPAIQRLVKSGVLELEDLEQMPSRYPIGDMWLKNGVRAVTIVPLIDREDLFGSLVVGLDAPGRLSENQLRIIQQVATQLSIALRQSDLYKQLENYTDSLETLVAERTAQLESKASELEAFTYSVSHDLRAPLRAMNGFSRTLLQNYEPELPEKAQHYLRRIQYNAQRMGVLIDDLLALSRLSRKEISYKAIDAKLLVQDIFQELQADRQVGDIKLTIHDLPVCWGDMTLLRQMWFNLIINAIKYTKEKAEPTIEIGFNVQNMQSVYYIKDNGVGFDMAYIDKLFGVFQRLHNPTEYEGTGIGLAIVRRIIERHHGQVWAKGAINEGATFYFTLGSMAKEEDSE